MTEAVCALVGFVVGVVPAVAVLVRYQDLVLRAFRDTEEAHRVERARLVERLAVRTAETPHEAVLQSARPDVRRTSRLAEAEPDEYRREAARRGEHPLGL